MEIHADIRSNNWHTHKNVLCLQKVHSMASDDNMLIGSAIDKLRELAILGNPKGML